MSDSVVKFYQFKLVSGTEESAFIGASQAMDKLLLDQPGFVYRSLAKLDGDLWQDIVYWADARSAAEAESLMSNEVTQRMVSFVDVPSVVATQAKVLSQVYPEMLAAEV